MKTLMLAAFSTWFLLFALAGTAGATNKSGEKFRADLTGDVEVPVPVVTDTSGDFRLAYDDFDGIATYRIRLNDGLRVFMAHIHCAPAGANGPIVVWLAGNPGSDRAWEVDGKWIDNASFTDADVIPGTGCGDNLAELIETLRNGGAYVNVHTRANPGGEVRGQIRPQ
jgi:hypothetical protein